LEDIAYLKNKISKLENKVKKLRASRRILLNMLENMESEAERRLSHLEKCNQILTRYNRNYRLTLLSREAEICHLKSRLSEGSERRTQ